MKTQPQKNSDLLVIGSTSHLFVSCLPNGQKLVTYGFYSESFYIGEAFSGDVFFLPLTRQDA